MDVVRVMNLCQVIEGPRLFGIRHPVCSAVVRNRNKSLFDVDIRCSVLTHRSELHEMTLRPKLLNRETRTLTTGLLGMRQSISTLIAKSALSVPMTLLCCV